MEKDVYQTINAPASGEYKEKGSRFLSFALPVVSEEEIKKHLQEFRKKYYDARHVCYGYILGSERPVWKGSDDGEPAHTAGTPIVNQIRARNLTNILVIVVRYFGGVKLGASGLIEAYKGAAIDCLSKSTPVEKYITITLELRFEASLQGEVMRLIKEYSASILSQEYESALILLIEIRKSLIPAFLSRKIQGLSTTIPGQKNH